MLVIDSQLSLGYSDVKCLKFKTLKPIKQPYASEILKPKLTGALCLKKSLSGKKVLLFHSFRSWTVWTFGLKKWCSPRSLSLASSGPRSAHWGLKASSHPPWPSSMLLFLGLRLHWMVLLVAMVARLMDLPKSLESLLTCNLCNH